MAASPFSLSGTGFSTSTALKLLPQCSHCLFLRMPKPMALALINRCRSDPQCGHRSVQVASLSCLQLDLQVKDWGGLVQPSGLTAIDKVTFTCSKASTSRLSKMGAERIKLEISLSKQLLSKLKVIKKQLGLRSESELIERLLEDITAGANHD